MNNKISIIIHVYNLVKHFEKCLTIMQFYINKNLERIFVNDGSTDSGREIYDRYSEHDKRNKSHK